MDLYTIINAIICVILMFCLLTIPKSCTKYMVQRTECEKKGGLLNRKNDGMHVCIKQGSIITLEDYVN